MPNEESLPENGETLSNNRGFSGDVEVRRVGEDLGKVNLVEAYEVDKSLGSMNDNGDEVDRKVGCDDSLVTVVEISRDFSKGTHVVESNNGQNLDGSLVKATYEEIGLDFAQNRMGATGDSVSTALSTVENRLISENDTVSGEILNNGDKIHSVSESETDDSSEEDDDGNSDIGINDEDLNDDEEEFEEGETMDLDAKKRDDMIGISNEEEAVKRPVKSKNELDILPSVPPVDVTLELHHQTSPVGVILSILGSKVIVEGLEKHNPLSEGSILWITETRSPLGLIDEIFGPVKNPYYIVRYNSEEEVPAAIQPGTAVSFVAEFVGYVLNDKTLYRKGYDASGENDEEVSEEVEFSDDEKEAEYRRMQRNAKRGKEDEKNVNRESVDWKNGNREFIDRKRAQNNSRRIERNNQLASEQPPVPPALDPSAFNQLQMPPVVGQLGCANGACSIENGHIGTPFSHVGLQSGYFGGPPQQVLPMGLNMFWPNGMPCQQQQHMGVPSWAQANGMPCQQHQHTGLPIVVQANGMLCQQQQQTDLSTGPQLDRLHECPHQHPQQQVFVNPSNGIWAGGLPYQHQFDPCQVPPNAMWADGRLLNQPAGPSCVPLQGFVGQAGFNQAPFGMGLPANHGTVSTTAIGRLPPAIGGNFSAPWMFNPGAFSAHHGRASPQRGRFSGRKGGQQPGS